MLGYLSKILVALGLPLLFIIGYSFTHHPQANTSTVTTEVAPSGTQIKIDGKGVRAGAKDVLAGKHTITASKAGFKDQSRTIATVAGEKAYVGIALAPNTPQTKNWYAQHPDDSKLADGVGSHLSEYLNQKALRQNTLLQVLPVTISGAFGDTIISSSFPLANSTQPAVVVTAPTSVDRQIALGWLRNNGYNPALMDIVFANEVDSYAATVGDSE